MTEREATFALRAADPGQLLRHTATLHTLYRHCFGSPPWSEPRERITAFPARLASQLAHPGAGGLLAISTDGTDGVVGAIYGWPAGAQLETRSPFNDAVAAAATPELASRLVAPALVVAELMVDPRCRRRGIGKALLAAYTAGWPAAWLSTHPDAPAVALYRQAGWRHEIDFAADGHWLALFTWRASTAADRPSAGRSSVVGASR